MARFSLHTVGRDRPGIISGVTAALARLGANLGDSRMTILHGQFAIMLVLDAPGISDGSLVEAALEPVAEELDLFIAVRPLPEVASPSVVGERFVVAVDGADRPGIVAGITEALADLGVNVVELASHLVEQSGSSGYVLRLTVVAPSDVEAGALESALAATSERLGVVSSIRRAANGDLEPIE